jgi:transcriptional regulator with XRE-family HTH domain
MGKTTINLGERIRRLRENEGISQGELAVSVGISRSAISQVESGERKIAAEELILFAKRFNVSMENLINPESEPRIDLPKKGTSVLSETNEIRISVPQKNLKKFKEVLLYILGKVGSLPNVGETVIYKLLYFIDFDYFEMYEEQLVGASYMKNHHGPTPIEFKKIVDRMMAEKEIEKVKSEYYSFPQTKYFPLRAANLSNLKANEVAMIDKVLCRFADWNASQISDYSHKDIPWMTTENGKIIPYESVFYRTAPYSVRQYGE